MAEQATREIVQVGAEERRITITFNDVKKYLCPKASDAEIGLFLKVCQSQNLNPFAREIYLIKYSDDEAAAIVVAIDAFLKAAETCDQYVGHEAGIILKKEDHRFEFREGTLLLEEEKNQLAGGWAKVYRKDRTRPSYATVNISEYKKFTKKGEPTRFWREMPATMIRNVALRHALKEAFPNRFAGLYSTADFEEVPEGQLPPAYTKNGEPDWPKFWARQKEKGLDAEEVHKILGISSLKEDWLGTGRTLEEAEDTISKALPLVTRANKLGLSIKQISDMLGMALREWFTQGKTVDEAIKVISEKLVSPKESAGVEEGFTIDLQWLKEAKQALKWTDETTLSFIASQYKVSGKTVAEALTKLTRQQAEDFVNQINKKLEKQSSLF